MSEQKYDAFGVSIYRNAHPEMRKIRRQFGPPAFHGNKLWKASLMLMDFLDEFPLEPGMKVLELGCGFAVAGIYCAKRYQAQVSCLDADHAVLPYAQRHAELNGVEIETWHQRYENLSSAELNEFDLVIGGDICFWDEMSANLFALLERCLEGEPSSVILADPARPPFLDVAAKAKQQLAAEYFEWHVNHPWNHSGVILTL